MSPSCIALPAGEWPLVIDFLAERFAAIPREELLARMRRGDVVDEHGASVFPEQSYRAHQKIYYYRSIVDEPRIPFDEVVLFQDDYLLVVDKPHFLPVIPAGRYLQETLLVRLKRKLGIDTLAPMHRIDRETAGLVLFTIQPDRRGAYQSLFSQHKVSKSYQAVAPYRTDLTLPLRYRSRLVDSESFMRMEEVAGEPNAETQIEVIERLGEYARYQLRPVTGKRHQLRVQMAALGIPILNDRIYPEHLAETDEVYSKPLQLLAESIGFMDPITGQMREFSSQRKLIAR